MPALYVVALLGGLAGAVRPDVKSKLKFAISDMPLQEYHLAHGGQSVPDLSAEDLVEALWAVFLRKGSAADMADFSSRFGISLVDMREAESGRPKTESLAENERAPEAVRISAARADPPVALSGSQEAADPLSFDLVEALKNPTIMISIGVCAAIVIGVLLNQLWTSLRKTWTDNFVVWAKPLGAALLFYCNALCFEQTLRPASKKTRGEVLLTTMSVALAWWLATFVYEVFFFRRPSCEQRDSFTANDVYCDLTEPMFRVTIRYLVQFFLMIVLMYAAMGSVEIGALTDFSGTIRTSSYVLAIAFQVFLLTQVKRHDSWEDLLRLRRTRAVEVEGRGRGGTEQQVIAVTVAEYYLRLAMAVITNGIFHKFIIVSFPLFIFTSFSTSTGLEFVKDALAITFVLQIDNIGTPVTFTTLVKEPVGMLQSASAEPQRAPKSRQRPHHA